MSVTVTLTESHPLVAKHIEAIEAAFPTEEKKAALADELKKTLSDPSVKKSAYDNVTVLAATILDIRALFVNVSGELNAFDKENFKDTSGEPIQLEEKWKAHINVRFLDFSASPPELRVAI